MSQQRPHNLAQGIATSSTAKGRPTPRAALNGRFVAVCIASVTASLCSSRNALAQDITGNYRLVTDSTTAEVPEWGSDCGQRPESHRGSTGRTVHVSLDGNNLVIEDRPRMRSDGCWSQNPRVRRTGGSGSSPRWTSNCSTPADDYQHEEATYTTTVEGNRINLRDRTQYSWQLRTSNCRATLTRTIAYERADAPVAVVDSGVVRPVVRDSGVVRAPARCSLPGPAARLSINNGRRTAAPGTRVCFRAQLVDIDGCLAINSGSSIITWNVTRRGESVPGEGGCFTVPANTEPNTEFAVTASANGYEDRLSLRVVTAEEYRSLVAQTIEEEDAGTAVAANTPTVTDAIGEIAHTPAPVQQGTSSRNLIVAILTTLALILLGVVAWLALRKKPAPKPVVDLDDEPTRAAVTPLPAQPQPPQRAPVPQSTPATGQPRPPRERKDEIPMSPRDMPIGGLPPMSAGAPQAQSAKKPSNNFGKVVVNPLPPPGSAPPNAATVVSVKESASPQAPVAVSSPKLTKQCPTCGQQFSEENAFCPEHGTPLVHIQSAVQSKPVAPAPAAQSAAPRNDRIQKHTMIAGSAGMPQSPSPGPAALASAAPVTPSTAGNAQIPTQTEAATLRCPICGKTFGPGNIFCGEDGSRLENL